MRLQTFSVCRDNQSLCMPPTECVTFGIRLSVLNEFIVKIEKIRGNFDRMSFLHQTVLNEAGAQP